jgi:hypothetical protein
MSSASALEANNLVVVPASPATIATREQLAKAQALTQLIDSTLESLNPLPDDMGELPVDIAAVLGPDERDLWTSVEQRGREHLLERSLRRRITTDERRLAQLQRQDLCAYYIDTLCKMSENRRSVIGEEAYSELRREYQAAKAAWEAVRGKTKRAGSMARTTSDEITEKIEVITSQ